MICLSFVQGRLSKKIGSKFQYFPINNWQNEMPIAKKIGFKHIEWIISDYNNPIFNKIFQNQILQVLKENKISISSIGLDFLMREPLFKIHNDDLDWILINLKNILKRFKAKRVNIPIEENSRLSNHFDYKIVKKRLHKIIKILGENTKISIESDLSLKNLDHQNPYNLILLSFYYFLAQNHFLEEEQLQFYLKYPYTFLLMMKI